MTTFLIGCAAMVVVALVLILVPLLREAPVAAKGQAAIPRAVPAAVALLVVLPLAASALYGRISNFPWDNPDAPAMASGNHAQNAGSMEEVTASLEQRLQQSPGDAEGWRMLGRTYLVSGRPADAVNAYQKASALTGGSDTAVELDLAEAIVLAGQPDAQPRAKSIIDAALAADPANQKALWYSGLIALRSEDTETTKTQWTRLLEMDPPEEIRQILVTQLQALGVDVPSAGVAAAAPAMGNMGGMGGADPVMSDAAGESASGRTIRIALSVDPAMAGKLRPGTALFVSAREPGIPGPPLAAVRLTTDALPTTVVLSDSQAMIEGRNLSSVDDVQIVARVSFGGTAVTTSGDLVGESMHKKGDAGDLNLVINTVAP